MGWLFGWDSRSDLARHLTRNGEDRFLTTHAHCCVGNVLWTVQETRQGETSSAATSWLAAAARWTAGATRTCARRRTPSTTRARCPTWHGCRSPARSGGRNHSEYQARRTRKLEVGAYYRLDAKRPRLVRVGSVRPRLLGQGDDGVLYRLPRQRGREEIIPTPGSGRRLPREEALMEAAWQDKAGWLVLADYVEENARDDYDRDRARALREAFQQAS